MKSKKFSGIFTALITPFKDEKVDYSSLEKLVTFQIENGIDGFVVNGTTAESPSLSKDEVQNIFRVVKNITGESYPLLLGTGSNSTDKTIENGNFAHELGADACLVVVPYYNKPTQDGITAHFKKVADQSKLPLMLYNVPGRTVVSMNAETTIGLSSHKNIMGVKEASGDLDIAKKISEQTDKSFVLSSGDDDSAIDFQLLGGDGVISVISHVIPKEFCDISKKARLGDQSSSTDYEKYNNLKKSLGLEPNPIPVKMALYQMGLIDSPELRLPMTKMTKENSAVLEVALNELGLK